MRKKEGQIYILDIEFNSKRQTLMSFLLLFSVISVWKQCVFYSICNSEMFYVHDLRGK